MKTVKFPGLVGEMARRGETRDYVAGLIGVTQSALWRRLTGITEWTISEIDILCEHYGKDYYELFKNEK